MKINQSGACGLISTHSLTVPYIEKAATAVKETSIPPDRRAVYTPRANNPVVILLRIRSSRFGALQNTGLINVTPTHNKMVVSRMIPSEDRR